MKRLILAVLAAAAAAAVAGCGGGGGAADQGMQKKPVLLGGVSVMQEEVVIADFRTNYDITKGDVITAKNKITGEVTTYPVTTKTLKFADKYTSFDVDGDKGDLYRLYQAAFNRQPDMPGLGFWIYARQADANASMLNIAHAFLGSDEFKGMYGAAPVAASFVSSLYNNVLHRAPEQSGYDWWLNVVNGGHDRGDVLLGFASSAENKANVNPTIKNGFDYIPYGITADDAAQASQTCAEQDYLGWKPVGSYAIINNMWNAKAIPGSTQCVSSTVYGKVGVQSAQFKWSYNTQTFDVHAYPEILVGWRQGAQSSTTTDLPKVVSAIKSIKVTGTADTSCDNGSNCYYDTAFDLWFQNTNNPYQYKPSMELMVITDTNWMNDPNIYIDKNTTTAVVGGVSYDVHYRVMTIDGVGSWPYLAYVVKTNTKVINVDLADFVKDAQSRAYMKPTDTLTTIEFGTEVVYGSGTTTINGYAISIK